jgi:hypothetical protein
MSILILVYINIDIRVIKDNRLENIILETYFG